MPGVEHRNLAWDSVDGAMGAANSFVEQGYTLTQDVFLAAAKTTPSAHDRDDVHVRHLNTDEDWRIATEIEQQSFDPSPSFQEFQRQQMVRNRDLVGRGIALWFGAFVRGTMVATMGLFVEGGLGRCLGVATAPGHRRNGYCSTLVHAVCSYGFAQMGAAQIVILTSPGCDAERVYKSVGFTQLERVSSLSRSGA